MLHDALRTVSAERLQLHTPWFMCRVQGNSGPSGTDEHASIYATVQGTKGAGLYVLSRGWAYRVYSV